MLTSSRISVATLVALATVATACTSSTKHANTSTSAPVAPSSSTPTAGTSSAAASASTAPASPVLSSTAPAAVSSAAASQEPITAPRIVVELARSHRLGKGDIKTLDIDELSVIGLPDAAAIAAVLQAPANAALADYTKVTSQQEPCTDRLCGTGAFLATFTTSRADSVVVSGSWSISTFSPGAAHGATRVTAVTVDSVTGKAIAPSQLFVGSSLNALAAATETAVQAKLAATGCNDEFSDGLAPTADNYVGTSIGPVGLLVGLSDYQVAAFACGSIDAAIPWSAVISQLSSTGMRFAATPPPVAAASVGAASVGAASVSAASTTTSATAPRCTTAALSVTLGVAKQVATAQYQVPLVFTNVSAQPCALLGFPGADFGAAGAQPVSLVRTSAKPVRVGLPPGGQAHASLTYLLGPDPACDPGGQWPTSTLTVTPPDDTTSLQIPWPNGSVDDCQTGATHPGSFIGPVVAN